MKTKVTQLFQCGTVDKDGNAARIGGFSESWYTDLTISDTELTPRWNNLCRLRAALLPANCRIVGNRLAQVDPVGASKGYDTVFPGTAASDNDLPQVALQFSMRAQSGFNNRQVTLRGVPDARVVKGEYAPSQAYNAALAAYFDELTRFWKMRAIDRTILPVKIVSISSGGLLTTEKPHGLAAEQTVQLMSVHFGDGPKVSCLAYVVSAPTTTTANIILPAVAHGQAGSGGRARKYLVTYPGVTIASTEVIAPVAVTRKVGAPFRKFRGRRTAKKS